MDAVGLTGRCRHCARLTCCGCHMQLADPDTNGIHLCHRNFGFRSGLCGAMYLVCFCDLQEPLLCVGVWTPASRDFRRFTCTAEGLRQACKYTDACLTSWLTCLGGI